VVRLVPKPAARSASWWQIAACCSPTRGACRLRAAAQDTAQRAPTAWPTRPPTSRPPACAPTRARNRSQVAGVRAPGRPSGLAAGLRRRFHAIEWRAIAARIARMSNADYQFDIEVTTRFLEDQSDARGRPLSCSPTPCASATTGEGAGASAGGRRHWLITDGNGKVQEVRGRRRGRRTTVAAVRANTSSTPRVRCWRPDMGTMRGSYHDAGRRRHPLRRADPDPFTLSIPAHAALTWPRAWRPGPSATCRVATTSLQRLLEKIRFDPAVGPPLVLRRPGESRRAIARNPAPGALRCARSTAHIVLGNHDLSLLAIGERSPRSRPAQGQSPTCSACCSPTTRAKLLDSAG
jgi:ApaG protein